MKDYDKNKTSSYLKYLDVNNLYDQAMSENLLVNNFEWIEDTSQFNEGFKKKTIMIKVMEDSFLKLMLNTPPKIIRTSHGLTIFIRKNRSCKK